MQTIKATIAKHTGIVSACTAALGFSLGFLATDLARIFNQHDFKPHPVAAIESTTHPGTYADLSDLTHATTTAMLRID